MTTVSIEIKTELEIKLEEYDKVALKAMLGANPPQKVPAIKYLRSRYNIDSLLHAKNMMEHLSENLYELQ